MALVILLALASAVLAQDTPRFERLMSDIFIADLHVDTPWHIVDEGYNLAEEHTYYETDIPRLRRGKAGAIFFGVVAQPQDFPPHLWIPRALENIDAVHEEVRRQRKDLEMAYTADDILRIRKSGRIAILLSLEGGHMIQDSPAVLRDFYRLGVRYMTLAHFKTNNWADSGTDRPAHGGLSPFGREIVREMNRIGMMVDISHVSDETFFDALEVTRAPVIASHSNVRAMCDIPRNMSDDMLRALAKNGGVFFLNFNMPYLDKKTYDVFAGYRDQRDRDIADMFALHKGNPRRWEMKRAIQQRYKAQLPEVNEKHVLRQIDHAVKIMGADHVGIGSDYDGISGMAPKNLEDVSKYPNLVKGMIELGYSDADIRKIMGENLLRVLRAAEKAAEK